MIGPPPAGLRPGEWRRLATLLALPTAPTREEAVAAWATAWLEAAGVPWWRDRHGNLVIGTRTAAEHRARLAAGEPLLCAHMDHPGWVGLRRRGDGTLEARWLGGGPLEALAGVRVWIAADGEELATGTIEAAEAAARSGLRLRIRPDEPLAAPARRLYGGLSFRARAWRRGERLHARALDDLAGVFAIVCAAARLQRPPPALLTRAEEVGFVGLVAHLEAHPPPEGAVLVSLEASRAGPGAVQGAGPVVRTGDRRSVFDPGLCEALTSLARRTLGPGFQRRLMDGGTCEATAAQAWGMRATGLAIPLGRYHNLGPGGRSAAETVHVDDLAGLVRLTAAVGRHGLDPAPARVALRRCIRRRAAPFLGRL